MNRLGVLRLAGWAAAAAGGALSVWAALSQPSVFYPSYLASYIYWLWPTLGGLGFLLLYPLVGGRWGELARPVMGAASAQVLLMCVLLVPVLLKLDAVFAWARPEFVAEHGHLMEHKAAFLNAPFFLARAGVYAVVWLLLSQAVRTVGYAGGEWSTSRLRGIGGAGLVAFFLTGSFAAIDLGMSLEPLWQSSLYPALFLVGGGLSVLAIALVARGWLEDEKNRPSPDRFHEVGTLMFAFVLLWAYMAYSQFMLIWYGNIPEEVGYLLDRTKPFWTGVAIALVVAHFLLPFGFLLVKALKRKATAVAAVAAWILLARWIDVQWLVKPSSPGACAFHWIDAATFAAVGGLWVALFTLALARRLPERAAAGRAVR